jgi:phage terminase Nu1 subunit (DNA packaging protein)
MNAPSNHISHDAAAGLLQITPDALTKLAGAGVVRRAAPGKYIPAQLIKDYIGHLHKEPDRRERAPTQAEVSEHLDMSDRNLRDVLSILGLDHKEVHLSRVRVTYIRHLREVAAGRGSSEVGGLDLVQERAALAREQRLGIEIKNAVARGEFAPISLLSEVLATASQSVVERFEQLPGLLKKSCPDLPDSAREQVMVAIAAARNEWVRATEALVLAKAESDSDDDEVLDA